MDSGFTPDQQSLVDTLSRALAKACPRNKVRQLMADGVEFYDRGTWRTLAELGALGAHETDIALLAAVSYSVGQTLAPVPVASSVSMALSLNDAQLDEALRAHYQKLVTGDLIGVSFMGEGLTLADGRLTGTAFPCFDALCADLALVRAHNAHGDCVALVDLRQPERVSRTPVETLDRSKPAARVTFIGAYAIELQLNQSFRDFFTRHQSRIRALVSFEQLAGAEEALSSTCNYVRDRTAFGRPIGSQQAVKHQLAEIWVKIELARGHCLYSMWTLREATPDVDLACASASIAAGDAFEAAARSCVHLHGASGFTWDSEAHLFYRRARALQAFVGSRTDLSSEVSGRLHQGERPLR